MSIQEVLGCCSRTAFSGRRKSASLSIAATLLVLFSGLGVQPASAQTSGNAVDRGDDYLDAATERYSERQQRQHPWWAEEQRSARLKRAGHPATRAQESPDLLNTPGINLEWQPWPEFDDGPLYACSFPPLSLDADPEQTTQSSGSDSDAASPPSGRQRAHERSMADINNQLNNPGADLAQLNFKLTWNQFQGDLGGSESLPRRLRGLRPGRPFRNLRRLLNTSGGEGASSQNSLALNFQPVFPFALADGGSFIVRPSIPVVWQPHYNARSRGFDEQFGLGDMQVVGFYSRTDMKKGYMWGAGVTMQIPTHTDDSLGTNQFQMGPAGFAGLLGKWGSAGLFPQHFTNIGGSDEGYTALTVLQPWYWFNVGNGYQIGGSPVMEYNWAADSNDEAWTVPVNLGAAKTIRIGKLPVKIKFEAIYYIVTPDSFGPQWGLQLTVTPVIPNPFEKHKS